MAVSVTCGASCTFNMARFTESSLCPGSGALGIADPVVGFTDAARPRISRRASNVSAGRQQNPSAEYQNSLRDEMHTGPFFVCRITV
jgi:hypothetical protein